MAEPILVKLVHSKATCCLFVKDSSQQLTPVLLKHSDVGFWIWKRTWHLTLGLPSSAAIWVILFPDTTNVRQRHEMTSLFTIRLNLGLILVVQWHMLYFFRCQKHVACSRPVIIMIKGSRYKNWPGVLGQALCLQQVSGPSLFLALLVCSWQRNKRIYFSKRKHL